MNSHSQPPSSSESFKNPNSTISNNPSLAPSNNQWSVDNRSNLSQREGHTHHTIISHNSSGSKMQTNQSTSSLVINSSSDASISKNSPPNSPPITHSTRSPSIIKDNQGHYSDEKHIFMFVNPTSGGNAASAFTEAGLEYLKLNLPNRTFPIHFWIWDIREGASGSKRGMLKLKSVVENMKLLGLSPDHLVYVIVGGGDGTVMWCVSELWEHKIDDSRIAIGVVPYGTGNDFARALGWQKYNAAKPFEETFKTLKSLVNDILSALVVWHDIWEVSVKVGPKGNFLKIDSATRLKKVVSSVTDALEDSVVMESPISTNSTAKMLTLKMCNYFSMGVESRIGVGFDRYRTKSQFCNKIRYGVEGTKKSFFKSNPKVHECLSEFSQQDRDGANNIIFSTKATSPITLLPSASIIACNIPSFAAGLDIWAHSRKLGVSRNKKMDASETTPSQETLKELLMSSQQMGDGRLEFISFSGAAAMGAERAISGHGKRIWKGSGPFNMTFREDYPASQRLYFQVDGEFFIMLAPQRVRIDWLRRLKVLVCTSNKQTKLDGFVKVEQ